MVCIIGDKYGYRLILNKIDKEVFQMFLSSVKSQLGSKSVFELLEKWYKLDENSFFVVYILFFVLMYYLYVCKNFVGVDMMMKVR